MYRVAAYGGPVQRAATITLTTKNAATLLHAHPPSTTRRTCMTASVSGSPIQVPHVAAPVSCGPAKHRSKDDEPVRRSVGRWARVGIAQVRTKLKGDFVAPGGAEVL